MKVGSLVFSTDQGLGYLAKAFFNHGVVTDVMVVAHGRRTEHPEWFPGARRIADLHSAEQYADVRAFCARMDAMLFFETPFRWELFDWCRECGTKTFLMPMHECTPDPLPALPDCFICPSDLDMSCFVGPKFSKPAHRINVPVEVPWRLRERAEVFVHNAGNGGLKGRNGTAELLEAIKYVESPAQFIIRTQVPLSGANPALTDSRVHFVGRQVPLEELWTEGDVFVFCEKFNGLSLPLQESYAAGMLVVATNRFPNNTYLPNEPLIRVEGYRRSRVSPRCREFDEAIVTPKDIAKAIDDWYGRDISEFSKHGRTWAEENSWEKLGPKYKELLCG